MLYSGSLSARVDRLGSSIEEHRVGLPFSPLSRKWPLILEELLFAVGNLFAFSDQLSATLGIAATDAVRSSIYSPIDYNAGMVRHL